MLPAAMVLACVALQERSDPPSLRIDEVVEGEIADGDPVVETPTLLAHYTDAPVVGRRFAIELDGEGPFTIALKSFLFDAYLVLRDADGDVLAEDDDGLIGTHARLVIEGATAITARSLDACALHGGRGKFTLRLTRGRPAELGPRERAIRAVEDARAAVEALRGADTGETPAMAQALRNLATLLRQEGDIAGARLLIEEVLRIHEKVSGPDHPLTATSLNDLATILERQGRRADALPLYERAARIYETALGEHLFTAVALGNVAHVLVGLGRFEEARPLYERALRIEEKTVGPVHPMTAGTLIGLAALLQSLGDAAAARPLLERSLAIHEEACGPMHPDTAIALRVLADFLGMQGKYAEAQPLLERALAIREAVSEPIHPETAQVLNSLALVLRNQGRFAEARPQFERALRIDEATWGPEHRETAAALSNLAGLLKYEGRYAESRRLYERALAIHEKADGPDHRHTAFSLDNLASLLVVEGEFAKARPLHERALEILESSLGPDHVDTAICLNGLAFVLRGQGNLAEARPLFERALRIAEKAEDPEHPDIATCLANLAWVLSMQGSYAEARPLYERALRIREKSLGPDHPDTAESLNNLALLLSLQGDAAAARPLFERALRIRGAATTESGAPEASILHNLAFLYWDQGNFVEAGPLLERALRTQERTLGRDHPSTRGTRGALADFCLDLGEIDRAFELASELMAAIREQPRLSSASMSDLERFQSAAAGLNDVEVLLACARLTREAVHERAAYDGVLAWKGRVSRELGVSRQRILASLDPEVRDGVEDLRAVQRELSEEVTRTGSSDRDAHERRLETLRERRGALVRDLERRLGPEDRGRATNLESVLAALPPGAALVDLLVHGGRRPADRLGDRAPAPGRRTAPQVTAWVCCAGSEKAERVELGDAARLQETVETYVAALTSEGADSPLSSAAGVAFEAAGRRLRELLWDPLAPHVGDAQLVFVAPDRFLGTLPFGTIPLADGSFLLERKAFVQLSCAAELVEIARASAESTDRTLGAMLVTGGVDHDARGRLPAREPAGGTAVAFAVDRGLDDARGGTPSRWEPLRFSGEEAASVAKLRTQSAAASSQQVLLGADASEEALKAALPGKRFVHLATHGFFAPAGLPSMWENARAAAEKDEHGLRPIGELQRITGLMPGLLTGLVCAGANLPLDPDRDNGLLTAEEVTWLDLAKCDLVVLSACRTGLGRDRDGDGMASLRSAFHLAGAKTVIASLWNVEDETTGQLMRDFYQRLWIGGESKLDALRGAQLALLRKNRATGKGRALPATWAAFVLSGEWR